MAQSDPDFLLESNQFLQSANDFTSTRAQALLQEKKNEFWNELINLRLTPPLSSSSSASTSPKLKTKNVVEWNVPRFRLTESFLQHAIDRESSGTFVLSHLFDPKTQTVILPADNMQSQCRTTVIYDVVVHNACRVQNGGVLDRVGDSYYKGDMIFHIDNVPKRSVSGTSEVVIEDVHRWFVNGAICGDDSVEIRSMKLVALKKTLFQLEEDMNSNVDAVQIYNENGKSVAGSAWDEVRETKVKHLQEAIQLTKKQVVDAVQALNSERTNHFSACELEITLRESTPDTASGTISLAVRLVGTEAKKEYYTNLICNKTNWSSEPMYATGDRTRNNKSTIKSNDEFVADCDTHQDERLVDVSKVAIILLPDGFGVHEAYYAANESHAFNRSHHRLFHGHFSKGNYREGTLYTNCGVFSGSFQFNEPCHGTMKYSDKIVIMGGYALTPQVDESAPLGSNPYRRGLHHHGNVSIRWKDGATYDGEMRNGCITGIGVYKYPNDGSEINGELVNGMLRSHTDDLMTSLLGTFMFEGTHSWRRHP